MAVVLPGSRLVQSISFLRLGVGENFHGVPAHKFRVTRRAADNTGAAVRSGA